MEIKAAKLYDGTAVKKNMFKYLNMKDRYSNGALFPFQGSTDLYPEVLRRLEQNPPHLAPCALFAPDWLQP